ncbi:LOW QUALITY PROTEIN: interferon regulatory factor 4 [Brachyhypopomus gauderio]|uniref:LOW QUALITY PROTEIN: interferon regulatory factor 4 n=1 Tax=Brachyhypopomus gauderio TaxID=698409 RepID=UPI00404269F8
MCSDGERAMAGGSGNGKLRQWLIEQVDTGKYPGLVWENDEKSIFRIPWKHAGKQDYNRDEDAALFKAWALFKGKYREGIDKPDPPTWKTRLRCALNKSNDFEELLERSQLDISDPYKVYRIVPEGAKKGSRSLEDIPSSASPPSYPLHPSYAPLQSQVCNFISPAERSWRDYLSDKAPISEITYNQSPYTPRWDAGYQFSGSFYSCSASEPLPSTWTLDSSMKSDTMTLSDYRLQVVVYYREAVVREVTVNSPDGCLLGVSRDGLPYGPSEGPELVELPHVDRGPLEHGVLLWVTTDGLYARRRCSSRVYWEGGHAPAGNKANKLEREQNCKLLDTQLFITELQSYALHTRLPPCPQVLLFFEDENTDHQRPKRTLTVQVEPFFTRQLLYLTHPGSMNYIRSHNLSPLPPEHAIPASQLPQSHCPSPQQWPVTLLSESRNPKHRERPQRTMGDMASLLPWRLCCGRGEADLVKLTGLCLKNGHKTSQTVQISVCLISTRPFLYFILSYHLREL